MNYVVRIYEAEDGSQILVRTWIDGAQDVCTRPDHYESTSWGPPLTLVRTEATGERVS